MEVRSALLVLACLAASPSFSTEKVDILLKFSPEFGEALAGKSVAIVRSEPPWSESANVRKYLMRSSPGPAKSGSVGTFDPAEVIEAQFAPEFARQYGMKLAPGEAIDAKSDWRKIAAVSTDADYLLYIQTKNLRINFEKNFKWNPPLWTGAGFQIALLDRKSGVRVMMSSCYSHDRGRLDLPKEAELNSSYGRLWDDIAASHAWKCTRHFADAFLPEPSAMPPPPPELVDPIADNARAHPRR
jgi:hypothetical protein